MSDLRDVSPISLLTGMTVLSLATGNKLGQIVDLFIDPINGVLLGATLTRTDGTAGELAHAEIYSFGRDALMVRSDESISPPDLGALDGGRPTSKLIGTKIITESGDIIGHITNVFVTLKPPPHIIYEARHSLLDKLLGREFFLPASLGHALSDDCSRLVVPDVTMEIAKSDLANLVNQNIEVRSFETGSDSGNDDTTPVEIDEDETVVRFEEDETLLRFEDDDDTVVRDPRRAGS